jgi:ABC-type Zn2+ transport system substrate-binding protein/surface adhesin
VEPEGHDHHDHDHDHDDNHDHDHGEHAAPPVDMEPFEQELTEVLLAVAEQFGDREPTEDELRAFLRDRLVAEGRSVEEADRFLDEMGVEEPPPTQ